MKMRVSIFIFVNIQNSSLYMIYYARVGVFLVKTKGDEVDGKSRVPFLLEKSGFSHVATSPEPKGGGIGTTH